MYSTILVAGLSEPLSFYTRTCVCSSNLTNEYLQYVKILHCISLCVVFYSYRINPLSLVEIILVIIREYSGKFFLHISF